MGIDMQWLSDSVYIVTQSMGIDMQWLSDSVYIVTANNEHRYAVAVRQCLYCHCRQWA